MVYENSQPCQDTDHQRHGDGQDQQQRGIGRSIRPGTAVTPTAFVSDMGDRSLLTEGCWRDGPSAYLSPTDTAPLRRELAKAFGVADLTPGGSEGDAL